jgi:hypothetical protein
MRAVSNFLIGCFCVLVSIGSATASCYSSGESIQAVWLSSGGNNIERWEVSAPAIHRTKLSNGFELGLKIEPAAAEKYREWHNKFKQKAIDEMVKISVYDMSGAEPKLLTNTWGGANSRQGYGPRGGADSVPAIGEPGIELWLHKPTCVKVEDIDKLKQ